MGSVIIACSLAREILVTELEEREFPFPSKNFQSFCSGDFQIPTVGRRKHFDRVNQLDFLFDFDWVKLLSFVDIQPDLITFNLVLQLLQLFRPYVTQTLTDLIEVTTLSCWSLFSIFLRLALLLRLQVFLLICF